MGANGGVKGSSSLVVSFLQPFSRPFCVARDDFVTRNTKLLFQFDKLGQVKSWEIFIVSGSNIIYHYLGVQPLV